MSNANTPLTRRGFLGVMVAFVVAPGATITVDTGMTEFELAWAAMLENRPPEVLEYLRNSHLTAIRWE